MKSLIKITLLLTLCVAGIGFYRGWFVLSSPRTHEESGKVDINLTVDKDKVHEDAETLKQKTSEITDEIKPDQTTLRIKIATIDPVRDRDFDESETRRHNGNNCGHRSNRHDATFRGTVLCINRHDRNPELPVQRLRGECNLP